MLPVATNDSGGGVVGDGLELGGAVGVGARLVDGVVATLEGVPEQASEAYDQHQAQRPQSQAGAATYPSQRMRGHGSS